MGSPAATMRNIRARNRPICRPGTMALLKEARIVGEAEGLESAAAFRPCAQIDHQAEGGAPGSGRSGR
jgi:hypothetical protein